MVALNDVLKEVKNFFKVLPAFYTNTVNWTDRLPQFIAAFHLVFLTTCILLRKSTIGTMVIIFFSLAAAALSELIHSKAYWYQDTMDKMIIYGKPLISKHYFDDTGYFVLAMWTLPIFIVSIMSAILMMIRLTIEIRRLNNEVKNSTESDQKKEETKEEKEEETVEKSEEKEEEKKEETSENK